MSRVTWPTRSIGDLFHIGAGKTMSAKAREGLQRTPFLRTSNVFWDEIDLSTVDEMAISDDELLEKSLQKGDLLVCEGGDIGRAAVWMGERDVMSFQNHLHRLRPKSNLTYSRFYVYFLQCGFTQLGIYEGAGNKTTIPNLSRNRLAALEVPFPSLDEQQAITNLLAMVRNGLNAHMKAEKLSQELKAACMQQIFTRSLPGEAQKETEIGLVSVTWKVKRLDEVAKVISTRMAYSELESTGQSIDRDVKVLGIKVSDMNRVGNEIEIRSAATTKTMSLAIASRKCAPPNTIVFPKRGAAIATNKKRLTTTWTVFDPNVIGVSAINLADTRFLFHWFQKFDLRTITEPGPTPQLNKKHLDPLLLPVPSDPDERDQIVEILDAIDQKIALHQKKKSVLNELFRSMLHKLMTGEVSVDDLDLSALTTEEPQRHTEAEVQS